jgi:hypothetical protein
MNSPGDGPARNGFSTNPNNSDRHLSQAGARAPHGLGSVSDHSDSKGRKDILQELASAGASAILHAQPEGYQTVWVEITGPDGRRHNVALFCGGLRLRGRR